MVAVLKRYKSSQKQSQVKIKPLLIDQNKKPIRYVRTQEDLAKLAQAEKDIREKSKRNNAQAS